MPELVRPTWSRITLAGLGTAAVAAVVNVVLGLALRAILDISDDFMPLGIGSVLLFTVVQMLAAAAVFGLIARRASRPLRTWRIVAIAALVVSWLPDLGLLLAGETPMGEATPVAVLALALLHLPAFAIAYWGLPRLTGLEEARE